GPIRTAPPFHFPGPAPHRRRAVPRRGDGTWLATRRRAWQAHAMARPVAWALAALCAASLGGSAQEPAPPAADGVRERSDDELRAAWKRLPEERRREVLEWVR